MNLGTLYSNKLCIVTHCVWLLIINLATYNNYCNHLYTVQLEYACMAAGKLFEKWHSFASRRLVVSTLSKVVLYLCTCTSIQITSNMNPATNGTFNYNNLYTILLL